MKKIYLLLIVFSLLMAGCGSAKKQLASGNYDAAIDKAVKALRKDPDSAKDIESLERAMTIATEQDNERIRYLKIENRAGAWDEIYLLYKKMSDRQTLVRTVTPLQYNGRTVQFPYVDYMQEMVDAKRNAADYYYAHGQELMKNGSKESYRQAYNEFIRAKEYVGDYEGLDQLIDDTRYLGISRVYVKVENYSAVNFPDEFTQSLLELDLPRLNSDWVEYYTVLPGSDTQFDYVVNVNVRSIGVSPDQQVQQDSLIKRNVEDGFQYVLDSKGNVMRDSLGNDIKVKKYKELQCALVQTVQSKECTIQGDVEVFALNPEKMLKKDPIGASSYFEHISARAIGDVNALSERQRAMIDSEAVPYPSDLDMVVMCAENLKNAIRGLIQQNKRYIN